MSFYYVISTLLVQYLLVKGPGRMRKSAPRTDNFDI